MAREHFLDLTQLEPPAPLQQALAVIEQLPHGDYIRLLVNRDPVFLYPLLMVQGFDYRTRRRPQADFEVFIWHRGDHIEPNLPQT